MATMTAPTKASQGVAADVSRLVGKPETFSNDKPAFSEWSFVMASYISAMSNEMGRLMVEAGDQSDRISLVRLVTESMPYAAQPFQILLRQCREEALEAIMAVESGSGFEAWLQLKRDSRPRSNSANRGRLHRTTKP
jgi:hypothetical protein